jgi:dihydropteroate synthase
MLPLIAKREVSIVLMFAKDSTPRTTVEEIQYDDVVVTIRTFLSERKKAAESAGVDSDHIILDPGMGHFISGDPKYSYEVLSRLQEFKDLDCSLLVSPSRKSFLAGKEKLSTEDRLPGTIVASAISVINGAQFIRTHDVEEVRRGCDVAEEIRI